MLKINSSGLMKCQRQSETTTGRTIALTSKETEDHPILEQYHPLLQDGGNCSRKMENSLSMKKERLWMFQEVLMLKTETLLFIKDMVRSTKDGRSSMLTSMLKNQRRES